MSNEAYYRDLVLELLGMYESAYLENKALRRTLQDLPGWDDAAVRGYEKEYRADVRELFAVLAAAIKDPTRFRAAIESLVTRKKQN